MISYLQFILIILTKNRIFHSYNTRTKDAVHSQSLRSSLGQRSITYKGAILWWYALPEELKGIVSVTILSCILKELYIND